MIESRKNLVANLEMQKHQVEEVVRDMFVKNTYDIKQYESLRDKVKNTSIFDPNSTIKSQNIEKGKNDLNSTAQNPVFLSSEYPLSNYKPQPM
jgi:hypothetical protein